MNVDSHSQLFMTVRCAASYLDKIVQHYFLTTVHK